MTEILLLWRTTNKAGLSHNCEVLLHIHHRKKLVMSTGAAIIAVLQPVQFPKYTKYQFYKSLNSHRWHPNSLAYTREACALLIRLLGPVRHILTAGDHINTATEYTCVFRFCALATSRIIPEPSPTCGTTRSWWLYSADICLLFYVRATSKIILERGHC